MVEICKEDVLDWYQGLNASHRVEIICALLDYSLPFELRFLGSVIENLGRKDFHILREAECRANSLHSSDSILDQTAICKHIFETSQTPTTMKPNPPTNPINHTGGSNSHSTVTTANENAVRASPTQAHDKKPSDKSKCPTEASQSIENGLSSSKPSTPVSSSSSESGIKGSDKIHKSSNNAEPSSEEESDGRKEVWLLCGVKRRKLILYLSLMSATNHDSANLYYVLLSDVEELLENLDWLEEMEDEILLLYTIGSHHPAFNFEQRRYLAAVLSRFKECMSRYSKDSEPNFQHPSHFNQILNHQYLPPQQYIYYAPPVQNIQSNQPSNQSLGSQCVAGAVRTPYHFQPYPAFPMFMSPQTHPAPLGPQPFSKNQLPILGSPSPVSTDSSKLMINVNGPRISFGRPLIPPNPNPPTNPNVTNSPEFQSLSSLENALMPPLNDPIEITCRPKKISCYNCGSNGHTGPECKEASMEEMTRKQYRVNYNGPVSDGKEGE